MTIVLEQATFGDTGVGTFTSVSVTDPSSGTNDVLAVAIGVNNVPVITPPTGFTQRQIGTVAASSECVVFTGRRSDTGPGPWTFTSDTARRLAFVCQRFSGCDLTTANSHYDTSAVTTLSSGTAITCPSITLAGSGEMVVAIVGSIGNAGALMSVTPPTSQAFVEDGDAHTPDTGTNGAVEASHFLGFSSGATGAITGAVLSSSQNSHAITLALIAGAGGAAIEGDGLARFRLTPPGHAEPANQGPAAWQAWAGTDTPSSAATFPQSFTGAVTAAGAMVRQAQKALLAGGSTATGALTRQAQKALLAGTSTAAGTLARLVGKPLAGATTAGGVLAVTKVALRAFSGAVTAAGTLARQAQKVLAGSSSTTGSILRQAQKGLAGSSTATGALAVLKTVLRAFSGSSTATGALTRQAGKPLTGASTATGGLTRQTQKPLAGSTTAAGALAVLKTILRAFTGASTAAGTLVRQARKPLAGSAIPSGTVSRQTSKAMAGSSTPSGATGFLRAFLRSFAGSATPGGVLARLVGKPLAGSATPTGQITRQARKSFAGSTAAVGVLVRGLAFARAFAGTITAQTTSLVRRTLKPLAGSSTPTGILTRRVSKTMAGAVTAAGDLLAALVLTSAVRLQAGAVQAITALARATSRPSSVEASPTPPTPATGQAAAGTPAQPLTGEAAGGQRTEGTPVP